MNGIGGVNHRDLEDEDARALAWFREHCSGEVNPGYTNGSAIAAIRSRGLPIPLPGQSIGCGGCNPYLGRIGPIGPIGPIREEAIYPENGLCASLLNKDGNLNKIAQVALGVFILTGIVVSILGLGGCSCLSPVAGNWGVAGSVISFVALKILRSKSSSQFDRDIDRCTSFSEMQELLNNAEMRVSCLGTRNLYSNNGGLPSTVDHLARRVERKIATHLRDTPDASRDPGMDTTFTGKTFIYEDRREAWDKNRTVSQISGLFDDSEDLINEGNWFTICYYYIPEFFRYLGDYNNIRDRYLGKDHPDWHRHTRGTIQDLSSSNPPRGAGYHRMVPQFGPIR